MNGKPVEIPAQPEKPQVFPTEPLTPGPSKEPEVKPEEVPPPKAPPPEVPPPLPHQSLKKFTV